MLYTKIVAHDELKKRLQKMVNSKRLPHALLFSGGDGCGNLPAALALAAHVLCKNKLESGACGECNACHKTQKLIHSDLHLVFPIIKSKSVRTSDDVLVYFREAILKNPYILEAQWMEELDGENKQSLIPVDEAASILKKLSYTSYEGGYKITLIWQPEKMNSEAANSLLKILEEPPEQTLFILVSIHPDKLLATILSRVQHIPFSQISESEIELALIEKYSINNEIARHAAYLSEGNFGEAFQICGKEEGEINFLNSFREFMRLAIKFDCEKLLQWIDETATMGREKHKQLLSFALRVFRDSLMYNYGNKNLVKLAGSEKQFLEKFASFINQNNHILLIEEFNNSIYDLERNANPKILFTSLYFKTNELLNKK